MRLQPPRQSVLFSTQDIYGDPIALADFSGRRVMLSFFRDAACPFCHFRIYELSNHYKKWLDQGLEVVAVFSSTAEEVKAHVARHPRPFRMIADPDLTLYNQYGVEHSSMALLKALCFKLPRIIRGIVGGGRPRPNPHVKLVPADFLIEMDGRVLDVWYGRNTSDHIPLERVQRFVDEISVRLSIKERAELNHLRVQNKQLKGMLQVLKADSQKA